MSSGLGRRFWLLYGGESLSAVGTAASAIALPVVTLHTTGDVRQAGLTSTALSVGIVLARLPAGVIADRYNRRNLLLVNNAIGAGLLGSLTLLLARDAASLWAILAAALLLGAVGSMLTPAENVAVRSFVPPALLPRALALIQTRAATAMVAGPLAAGALLTVDAQWVFAADTATFLVSALCIAAIPAGPRPRVTAQSPLRAAAEGIRFIWRVPFLRYAAVNATVLNLVFNGLLIVVIAATDDNGSGGVGIGLQTAALGAGALVGSLVAAPVAGRVPPVWGMTVATLAVAVALSGFAMTDGGWASSILLALAAAAGPVITVVISTVQIRLTPEELQGRVHSGIGFLAQAIAPLGPVLAGVGTHAFGLTSTVTSAALTIAVVALVGGVVVARHSASAPFGEVRAEARHG